MAKPIKEFRAGNVRASLWQNEVQKDGKVFLTDSIRIERMYKDKKGIWQGTVSFRKEDLPKLRLVIEKAYEFLLLTDVEGM